MEIVTGDNGAAQAVRLERTQLQQADDGRVLARGTGQFELVPADLVLVSIGYRSVPIEGAGFDADRGVILNRCFQRACCRQQLRADKCLSYVSGHNACSIFTSECRN